ncbi:MAG: substrate-binding domain-containing protein, partial [Planctomycetota bacterium]
FDPTYQLAEHIRDDAARRRLRILSCNSDLDIPGRHLNPDDEDGTRQAVHHLVELGHTRIGYIGPEPIGQGRETVRWRGYRHTMEEYGFEPSDEMIHFSGWVPSQGESIKPAWLADGAKRMPTAVLCANDQIAARVIRQARRNGLTVPTDLSVIGFSNELLGNYIDPQLTTIHQSYPELGRRALELLIEEVETNALDGTPKRQTKKSRAKDQVLMPVELVERETTAKPRKR